MKDLCIVRHAKSDWGEDFLEDIDRHLSPRGLRDAYFMSSWFAKNKSVPDLILSSPANRAISTAFIFARALKLPLDKIKLESSIYEADTSNLFSLIKGQDNRTNSILLFGHNPGLTNFCNELSEDVYFDSLPTCAISSYQFGSTKWKDIEAKKGKLNFYEFPKNFKNPHL